ncbi:MAG: leucine-rich repeat domain-containing protein, partial [Mariniblastus sp.]|nr:leucine-rich repeat domain-containing protein [Mariniblastus sp.]
MSSEEKQLPKRKRRWFQLRLRTLLVLVTLASGAFGWVGWELDQRRREKVAIAWVEKMGGSVDFDGFLSSGLETNWWKKTKETLFGKSVRFFDLGYTQVSDLSPLAELKKLECLSFDRAPVSDLSPLAGLENLRRLYLDGT